jgi:hypothetical protein
MIFDSIFDYRRWHYLPPPYIEPFTTEQQFAYVLLKLFAL